MHTVRRGFVDVAHGQMHYRTCGDPSLPALVMFHGSPGSGYSLVPLACHLAAHRHVIALDTAGNGDSAPLPQALPDIADLAEAHWQAIEALGLCRVDLYGYHTGAAICTELSIRHHARIGRIVMDGLSVFDPTESGMLVDSNHAPVIPIDYEGTQFAAAWTMVRDAHLFWPWWDRRAQARRGLGLPSAGYLHGEAIEVLKACETYCRSYLAALRYPKKTQLPLERNPVLVTACPSDQLFSHLDKGADLIPGAQRAISPERADDAKPAAQMMLDFLMESQPR
jgi:pimeloyl-ACP methyl ester carboxylesterase